MISKIKSILKSIGPGFIIASVVLGPGSITVSSQIGSVYGYSFLWVIIISAIFMANYTSMSARFGVTNDNSILQTIAVKYGRWFAIAVGVSAFLSSLSFQFGNNIGVGIGMHGITGINERIWPLIFTPLAIILLFWAKNLYKILEKLMMVLVGIIIISFFINLTLTSPQIIPLAKGFIPQPVAGDQYSIVSALMGTTFCLAVAMYYSYLAQNKGWKKENLKSSLRDTYAGMFMLAFISCIIIITSAASLNPFGIKVNSAADMAIQLESLFGVYAKVIFSLGLCAAAFSSLMVNSVVGGGLLADGLGMGRSMNEKKPKIFILIILLAGMFIAVFLRGNIIYALIIAQASSILSVPLVAIGLIMVLNSKEIMGKHRNNWWQNVIAFMGLLSISLMVFFMYRSLVIYLGSL
jgi:manganese transport protein